MTLIKKILKASLILICLLAHARAAADKNQFYLAVGQTRDLYAPPSAKVRVEKRAILTAIDLGNKIRVLAKKEGESTLLIGQQSFRVIVVSQLSSEFAPEFKKLVQKMLGPQIDSHSHPLTITGNIYRAEDWQSMARLAENKKVMLQMKAQIDSDVLVTIENEIKKKLEEQNLPYPQFQLNFGAKVTYSKKYEDQREALSKVFSPYGIKVQFISSQLKVEPLVRIQIVVAEVSRLLQNRIGVSWPSSLTAQISPKLKGPNSIEVTLQAIEDEGLGQILASPTLLAKSGGQAEFLAGGEIPIRLSNNKRLEVTWKRHGIFLQMKPQADLSGQIKMDLTVEVSTLDGASIDGLPSIKTNKISSQFDLAKAETIVLSGLVRNDWARTSSGLPGLKDLPIIGGIFSSRSFLEARSELVIFVTPQVIQQ
jgi:pilus assembly protein CpaC